MICALTVRRLEPGSFDDFREAFLSGWTPRPARGLGPLHHAPQRRGSRRVITFGHFDGTVEELRRNAEEMGYADQVSGSRRTSCRAGPTGCSRWWSSTEGRLPGSTGICSDSCGACRSSSCSPSGRRCCSPTGTTATWIPPTAGA